MDGEHSDVTCTNDGRRSYCQMLMDTLVRGNMDLELLRKYGEFFLTNYNPPCPEHELENELENIITVAMERDVSGNGGLTAEVRKWIIQHKGYFFTTDLRHLTTDTTDEGRKKKVKHICSILSRMAKDGDLIEKTGRRAGEYRVIERNFNICDMSRGDREYIDIKLPFGLQKYVGVKPSNLIQFAGVKNTGKSAILLNCAKLNMHSDKRIWFFSFEADGDELYDTISQDLEYTVDDWAKNVTFVDDPPNYIDIIQPDDINIIDYVRARGHEEAYHIPKTLAAIQERLNKGVAIVALQKNKEKTHAVGGEQTEATARLACLIDRVGPGVSRLFVSKAKIKGPVCREQRWHPEGLTMTFKTDDGINLEPIGRGWKRSLEEG